MPRMHGCPPRVPGSTVMIPSYDMSAILNEYESRRTVERVPASGVLPALALPQHPHPHRPLPLPSHPIRMLALPRAHDTRERCVLEQQADAVVRGVAGREGGGGNRSRVGGAAGGLAVVVRAEAAGEEA